MPAGAACGEINTQIAVSVAGCDDLRRQCSRELSAHDRHSEDAVAARRRRRYGSVQLSALSPDRGTVVRMSSLFRAEWS